MARGIFGERLKRERELREVPLEEITFATRIGTRFLEALENEDWDKLPGGVFNRGFVRSIARYLGLDEEAFLAEYDLAHNAHAQLVEQKHAAQKLENRIPQTPLWIPITMVFGVLVLLGGLVFGGVYAWRKYAKHPASVITQTPFPAPSASVPATPPSSGTSSPTDNTVSQTAPVIAPLDLSVSTSSATHVTIQADGATIFDGDLRPNENRHFSANTEFVVIAADSSAVLLELNGEAMPPLGSPGASGTMTLSRKNLRQTTGGNTQP
ncbi:MAG TPA: RodZ domain-containing protein [Candidatus Acidoferrum sp.]|nr:RodZ domain-containing protein [Candidatus Acidoferrum sp.]